MQDFDSERASVVVLPLSDLYRFRTMLAMHKFFNDFLMPENRKRRATIKVQKPFPEEYSFRTLADCVNYVRNQRLAITSSKCLIDDYLINLLRKQLENLNKRNEQPDYIHLKTDWTKCYVNVGYTFTSEPIHEFSLNSSIRRNPWDTVIQCKYCFKVNARVEYLSASLMYKYTKQLDELFEDAGLLEQCDLKCICYCSHRIQQALILLFKRRLLRIPVDIQIDEHYSHQHCKYNQDCEIKLQIRVSAELKVGKKYCSRTHQSIRPYPKLNTRAITQIVNKIKRIYLNRRTNHQQNFDEQRLLSTQDLNYYKPICNTDHPFGISKSELFVREINGLCE